MNWQSNCYARLLIDNHITDQKPHYMSRFDPATYVEMVKLAGVDSAMVYACDHNGNSYYPTKVGHQHAGLHGRDIFGETVKLLAENHIVPIAYHTIIFHNHSAQTHPEWQQRDANGDVHSGRYFHSCPNHPDYLRYAQAELAEILAYPEIQGIFIDMTFWPKVCQCPSCRKRFGKDIPQVIDWNNPEWVKFQRFREKSMADFAAKLSATVKKLRPDISVTHQFSPVLHGWFLGQSSGIAAASDYASGDFYGGREQHRLGTRLLEAYTRHPPFEFMTSRCMSLQDHTSTKSEDELFLHAVTTLANGGAYFFIDAINPDGTLERKTYEMLHRVATRLKPFKEAVARLKPKRLADCGLYFSMMSGVNPRLDGMEVGAVSESSSNMAVRESVLVEEVVGTAELLNQLKIQYRVLTDQSTDFSGLDSIIINNSRYLSSEECDRLRKFVADGGTLIATGLTSLQRPDGSSGGDFQLADLFGVSYTGKNTDLVSYMDYDGGLLSTTGASAPLVTAAGAKVLSHVTLPDFPVFDPAHYASIHSNPPGTPTDFAALTECRYGKGRAVYLYSSVLRHRQYSQQCFGRELFSRYLKTMIETNLPGSAEATLLESTVSKEKLLCIVNYQNELPNLPLFDVELAVKTGPVKTLHRVSDGAAVPFDYQRGALKVTLPRLDDAEFLLIS